MFKIGDTVKFSDKGLERWMGGRRGFFKQTRYRKWRWKVVGVSEEKDRDGKPLLFLERCDIKPYVRRECWSPIFFEVCVKVAYTHSSAIP